LWSPGQFQTYFPLSLSYNYNDITIILEKLFVKRRRATQVHLQIQFEKRKIRRIQGFSLMRLNAGLGGRDGAVFVRVSLVTPFSWKVLDLTQAGLMAGILKKYERKARAVDGFAIS
jgi:hypothetical protein